MDGSGARATRSPRCILAAIAQDYIVLQVGGQYASLKALQDWRG